jgi:hypothetical protein
MKIRSLAIFLLLPCACSDPVWAKEHEYQTATIVRVDSAACGAQSAGNAGDSQGADSHHKKSQVSQCQEYVLQSYHVIFRIRANSEKHPALLPIGEIAEFRVGKGKLVVRVPDLDRKEREYDVISISPLEDDSAITATK